MLGPQLKPWKAGPFPRKPPNYNDGVRTDINIKNAVMLTDHNTNYDNRRYDKVAMSFCPTGQSLARYNLSAPLPPPQSCCGDKMSETEPLAKVRFKRLDLRFLEIGALRVVFTKRDPEFPGISGQVV
eukprot:sb/3475441/